MRDVRQQTLAEMRLGLLREAALDYARRGWAVLPVHTAESGRCSCGNPKCPHPGKHPVTQNGLKDATLDTAVIRRWLSRMACNIGVLTGAESGILVVDVDAEAGGYESLSVLEGRYGGLPSNCRSLTGGGGLHFFFKSPGSGVRNSAGKLGRGLDVRGEGGYIIVPPSVHVSGQHYEWAPGGYPGEVGLAEAPAWLMALLANPGGYQRSTRPAPSAPISDGQRNATLASLAGSMRRRGMSLEAISAALIADNAARCRPPLADDEVRRIAESVGRYEPNLWKAIYSRVSTEMPKHIASVDELLAKQWEA